MIRSYQKTRKHTKHRTTTKKTNKPVTNWGAPVGRRQTPRETENEYEDPVKKAFQRKREQSRRRTTGQK
jgi:hypothetical protein